MRGCFLKTTQLKCGTSSPQHVFADFAGSRHNLRMPAQGLAVSTRCGDSNIVLVRSMKGA